MWMDGIPNPVVNINSPELQEPTMQLWQPDYLQNGKTIKNLSIQCNFLEVLINAPISIFRKYMLPEQQIRKSINKEGTMGGYVCCQQENQPCRMQEHIHTVWEKLMPLVFHIFGLKDLLGWCNQWPDLFTWRYPISLTLAISPNWPNVCT